MGFDIPMNTKGALDLSSMVQGLGGGAATQQPQQQYAQPQQMMQPQMQPQMQQYQQPAPQMQQQYQQPQPMMQQAPVSQPMTAPAPKQRPTGNGVHLKKGQKVALGAPGQTLTSIKVGLGWDVTDGRCDLDASAFMLGADGRVIGDDWFVFYGQTNSPDGSVIHSGDSQGNGAGDDETITINLTQINPNVKKITFVVTIDEALTQGLNFSMVANAYVRVMDGTTGAELNKFLLTDYYSNVTAMVVGEIYNHNGQWKFNAVGDGVAKDLAGLCAMYGVNVAD